MGALFMLARAELRARWRALVALGVLVGIVGAVALAALAGARRTATAYERLEGATHIGDIHLLTFAPGLAEQAADLPSVESAWLARFAVGRPDGPRTRFFGITSSWRRDEGLFTPVVAEGRMFRDDRMEEIVVTEQIARSQGLEPGDALPMKLLTAAEFGDFDVGFGEPDGPRIEFRVTGLIRIPGGEEGFAVIFGSPALAEFVENRFSAVDAALFRLRRASAGLEEFRSQVGELAAHLPRSGGAEQFELFEEQDIGSSGAAVAAASGVLVAGLLAFAAVAVLVGGFIGMQAISRYMAGAADDHATESALGMTTRQRAAARTVPSFIPAILGATLAVAGAVAASQATPIGSVAQYEPSPGVDVDVALLAGGAAAICMLVALAFLIAGMRALRLRPAAEAGRTSAAVESLAAMGVTAPTLVGLRFSWERGHGRTAVPVRSAMTGVALGIAGVVAVAAFAASLDRLVATPVRWGWQGHLQVIDLKDEDESRLLADERVAAFARIQKTTAGLPGGATVDASSFSTRRGSIGWTMLEGTMPQSPDEVAVGPRLSERHGLSVGDSMTFDHPLTDAEPRKLVVGIGFGPPIGVFADGIVMTEDGLEELARTDPFVDAYVRLADGVDLDAFVEEMGGGSELTVREPPPEVANLGGLGRLPDALAGILALIAAAALGNALIVGVRRRRRDIAVLRALGFVRSQIVRAVRVSAVSTISIGLVIGIPAGLIIGNLAWRAVASYTYVAEDPALPAVTLAVIAPATFAVALIVSALPARRAARLRPAEVLQAE